MNDEFFITKTVDTGSEGSKVVKFQLYARNSVMGKLMK